MSRAIYYTATTLDGYLADADDSLDWLFRQDQDHAGALNYAAFIDTIGAIVMGSTTYRWILDHRAAVEAEVGKAWPYAMPCFVMTTRELAALPGEDIRFVRGDPRAVHALLDEAAGDKDIWVVGGGDLAGQFADHGLLDEVIVYLAPVTLGAGRPLLPRRLDLELLEATQNRAFIAARYRVLGRLHEDRGESEPARHGHL